MPSPVLPNQIKESIPSLDGDFCEKFASSLNSPELFYNWFVSVFNNDGTLTDEFKAMVCLATSGTGGDPTTPPTPPGGVTPPDPTEPTQPPAGLGTPALSATRGLPNFVRLTWTQVTGHTHFHVRRFGQTIAVVPANRLTYDDLVARGRSYLYTVVAVNNTTGQISPPSNEALGYTGVLVNNPPL